MAELVISQPRGADLEPARELNAVPAHAGAKGDQILWRHAKEYETSRAKRQAIIAYLGSLELRPSQLDALSLRVQRGAIAYEATADHQDVAVARGEILLRAIDDGAG